MGSSAGLNEEEKQWCPPTRTSPRLDMVSRPKDIVNIKLQPPITPLAKAHPTCSGPPNPAPDGERRPGSVTHAAAGN